MPESSQDDLILAKFLYGIDDSFGWGSIRTDPGDTLEDLSRIEDKGFIIL